MSALSVTPAVFGEPLAWATWIAVGATSALWPSAWPRSWALAGAGLLVLGAVAGGGSIGLLGCLLLWALSLVRLGASAGELGGSAPARASLGAAAVAMVVAADVAAAGVTGPLGGLLDAVAPSVALREVVAGSVSLGALATLAVPAVLGWAGAKLERARRESQPATNAAGTAVLAPCVLVLLGMATEPLPAVWDGTPRGSANLHPTTVEALHRLDRPLLLTTLTGGPRDGGGRAAARRLERLVAELERTSMRPISMQRLDPAESAAFAASEGLDEEGLGAYSLALRALDRQVVVPLPDAAGLQAQIAAALWALASPDAGPVLVVGDAMDGLDLGRPVRWGHPQDEAPPPGTAAIVLVPSSAGLSPAGLAMLDGHVMGGGGLLVLYGDPLPNGPRRGVPLTNPWGFHAEGEGHDGEAVASGDWEQLGFDGMAVPADAPQITGPDGLGEAVAQVGGAAVAMAMIGSVPSGFPDGPRPQSAGAVRAFLTSATLARANPALPARALDWVLDQAKLGALRSEPAPLPGRSPGLLSILGLLGPMAVLGGGRLGAAREE